ncbi:MAG: AEC family transporter [Sellimonas intestinalis]
MGTGGDYDTVVRTLQCISVASAFLLYKKTDEEKKTATCYGTIVSTGIFGNPVIESIYGTSGLLYAAVFMLPVRVVMWSVGVSCFLPGQKKNVLKKVITHPCIVAIYLGLIVMVLPMAWPDFFLNGVEGLSSANTPVSMMLIGMMLAEMDPRGLVDRTMVWYASAADLYSGSCIWGDGANDTDPGTEGDHGDYGRDAGSGDDSATFL